jgi:hypothetical protein
MIKLNKPESFKIRGNAKKEINILKIHNVIEKMWNYINSYLHLVKIHTTIK